MDSPVSAPELGDASIGLKTEVHGVTTLQNSVLVGAVMMNGAAVSSATLNAAE